MKGGCDSINECGECSGFRQQLMHKRMHAYSPAGCACLSSPIPSKADNTAIPAVEHPTNKLHLVG